MVINSHDDVMLQRDRWLSRTSWSQNTVRKIFCSGWHVRNTKRPRAHRRWSAGQTRSTLSLCKRKHPDRWMTELCWAPVMSFWGNQSFGPAALKFIRESFMRVSLSSLGGASILQFKIENGYWFSLKLLHKSHYMHNNK